MLIVANYKMSLCLADYKYILKQMKNKQFKDTELVLCPPFVYLQLFHNNRSCFKLGAQDVSAYDTITHTGQINACMLKDFDVKYVIIAHNERRNFETDIEIANKVKKAQEAGIMPIICVGETKKTDSNEAVINQLKSLLLMANKDKQICFAYEPVWSIGTGIIPTNSYINKKVSTIKKEAKKLGFNPTILYGGSVNENNCITLKKCKIDGFLLGGLSNEVDRFLKLLEKV